MFCVLKIDIYEQGVAITLAAISLGASVIERHFTLDRQQVDNHFEVDTKKKIRNFKENFPYQKGSDHQCSLEPVDLACLVKLAKQRYLNINTQVII